MGPHAEAFRSLFIKSGNPSNKIAKVGDTIRVTNKSLGLYGEEFVVSQSLPTEVQVPKYIDSNERWCFLHSSYKVIKGGDETSSDLDLCPDCNGTGKIELFTSTIKCSCVE